MSSALFDAAAQQYDDIFTNSEIGKLQRARVWNYLDSVLPKASINILELNCGTGEDAIWLANKGHTVLATDISKEMINVTRSKVAKLNLADKISVKQLDINKIETLPVNTKFNLVFSNFGGLNCLTKNELISLSKKIKNLLNSDGKFIAVVMPDFCMIESLYFFAKLNFKNLFRRKKTQQVEINDSVIDTYYYNSNDFYKFFRNDFTVNNKIGIGLFIPPSYLNNLFKDKSITLNILNKLENIFGSNAFAASFSDHYLIELNLIK